MHKSTHIAAFVILILGCVALMPSAAHAADYYVAPNGDDTAPGTLAQPWRSLAHAGNTVQAGDTVYVRAGTYTDDYFWPQNSGTAAQPITVRAHPGEAPVLTGAGYYGAFLYIGWSGSQYFVIDGLRFENTTGENVIRLDSASHNTIRNCQFRNHEGTTINVNRSDRNVIERNTFDTAGDPSGAGSGDHIYVLGSDYNLIQGNYFTRAGHAAIDVIDYLSTETSEYNVIRDNVIEQHWGGGIYVSRGSSRTLIERNTIRYAGVGVTTYPKTGLSLMADDNIVRFNVMANASAAPYADPGMTIEGFVFQGRTQNARRNRLYNNVVYGSGKEALFVTQRQNCVVSGNKFLNNIVYKNRVAGPYEQWIEPDGNYTVIFETYHANADNKWAAFPNENFFHHNLMLHADANGDRPGEDPFIYYDQNDWGHSLTWVDANFSTYFHHNIEQNPRFIDAAAGNFRLQADSPAIDAGDFLARTRAAGGNTATVPVDDAAFFADGSGLVEGDSVKVGTQPPVRIVAVDYATNTLTLAQPVSFAADETVSLAYSGTAPDMGAYEYLPGGGDTIPPAAPTNLTVQ
jgi:parallel beta-helix repeat protein